jgi:SagB-type dehydrogenase family enzyme
MDERVRANRDIMKSHFQELRGIRSDQQLQRPQPPLQQPSDPALPTVSLPRPGTGPWADATLHACLRRRRSRRAFRPEALSLEELSFLLWATQGVQRVFGQNYSTFRPVPSGGARHPFETYLAVRNVDGLVAGLYRYLPLTHELLVLRAPDPRAPELAEATVGQTFIGEGATVFIWSAVPYRSEWRYDFAAHKLMLIDAGHVCQNLYLACEAIGCGTCAIADYDQAVIDRFLGIDGDDEFVVYLAPVGRCRG